MVNARRRRAGGRLVVDTPEYPKGRKMRTAKVVLCGIAGAGWLASAALAATVVAREPETLRLGERVLVEDGSCPAGQIREVVGVSSKGSGTARVGRMRQCVPRRR